MDIQEATRACRAQKEVFARPTSWRGTGEAVDLALRLKPSEALRITALGAQENLLGSVWKPNPEDFLGEWETITLQQLGSEKA